MEAADRLRYLRACDRCRRRKMRCDSANPCEKCSAAGLVCTFDMQATKSSDLATSKNAESSSSGNASSEATGNARPPKRRRSEHEPSSSNPQQPAAAEGLDPSKCLDPQDNSHFWMSSDGMARFAGTTSGLPLLEAARKQLQKTDADETDDSAAPNWDFLSSLLRTDGSTTSPSFHSVAMEDTEYFPARDLAPGGATQDVPGLIMAIIPLDLFATLIRTYFDVVHPVWPILYPGSFSTDIYAYRDPSLAAVAVGMCMLATRYTSDTRVLADQATPASAGCHYFALFRQLRDAAMSRDNVLNAVQALFLAGMFHCVDNIPHAIAQALFAEAAARCLDGGLHRNIASLAVYDSIEKQTRSRTAWACYIWDKQLAAICGRGPMLVVWDFDVSLPSVYEQVAASPMSSSTSRIPLVRSEDERHCKIFVQHCLVIAILERALAASMHPPVVENSDLLNRISKSSRPALTDEQAIKQSYDFLRDWRESLSLEFRDRTLEGRMRSPLYGAAYEQLAGTERMIELLLAGRKLQLATSQPELHTPKSPGEHPLRESRAQVLEAAKEMVNSAIHLGAANLLGKCDILLAFRLLVAGRMLLAVGLSARSEGERNQQDEAESAAQAVSLLLRHLAAVLPISLGSAEVFDETCRVCRVNLRKNTAARSSHYAWYRPLSHRNRSVIQSGPPQGVMLPNNAHDSGNTLPDIFDMPPAELDFGLVSGFPNVNPTFQTGHMALPFMDDPLGDGMDDLSWLLPGGNIPYYIPDSAQQ